MSADTRVRLSDQTVLTAQIAGSFADMPFRDAVLGGTRQRYGQRARVLREDRAAQVDMSLTALTASGSSPDYRADLGFTRRVEHECASSLQTTYNSEPRPDARLISWSATNVALAQWDWQGRADFVYVYPQAAAEFQASDLRARVRLSRLRAAVRGRVRRAARARTRGRVHRRQRTIDELGGLRPAGRNAPSEALALSVTLSNSWDVFDYDFGAGPKFPRVSPAALIDPNAPLDPGPATSTTASAATSRGVRSTRCARRSRPAATRSCATTTA